MATVAAGARFRRAGEVGGGCEGEGGVLQGNDTARVGKAVRAQPAASLLPEDGTLGRVLAMAETSRTPKLRQNLLASRDVALLSRDPVRIRTALDLAIGPADLRPPEPARDTLLEIYKRLRPGDPPTLETAYNLFNNLFFNPERYDLGQVGRLKLNHKFKLDEPLDNTVLTNRDIRDPKGWSRLQPPGHRSAGGKRGLDFWVICDERKAHLFFTILDGRMWREETSLEAFPRGWSEPRLAIRADIFEAGHVYRLRGLDRYLALVEAQHGHGWRYYKAYLADRLDGEWTPLAATKNLAFASGANTRPVGERWRGMDTFDVAVGDVVQFNCEVR